MSADPSSTPVAGSRRLPVAFCPLPPLLVPEVAGRAADDTAELRRACAAALAAVLSHEPDVVVVVGAGEPGVPYRAGDLGTLRGFGVDLDVPFDGPVRPDARRVPLPHTIGADLLDRAGWSGTRLGVAPADLPAALQRPGRVGVLAMGDGSARRTLRAPGHLDPAARPFDAAVAAALGSGDAAALAALDLAEGERLLAAGVPTWRAVGQVVGDVPVQATLRYDGAPFGVGYLVADWVAG